jgi:CBS domain-containing protein
MLLALTLKRFDEPQGTARCKENRMKVRDMMHVDVVTATPDTSLAQGQRLMHDKGIRHLPVVSGTELVGIVTDRDIREASPSPATTLSKGEINYQMDTTPIRTCMIRNVVVAQPDEEGAEAARTLLDRKFGCLPVVEGKRLVGVLTETDCLRAFVTSTQGASAQLGRTQVKDYMQTDVITAIPENLLSAVAQQMRGRRMRHVPVVTERKQVIGLVSDRDIRQAVASDEPHLAQFDLNNLLARMTIKSVMSEAITTVRQETSIGEAGQLMLDHKYGCLPVVRDENILEGILTVTDLLRAYVEREEQAGAAS